MKRKRAVITPQMRDDAIVLLSKGWTTDRVAKKYKVSTAAVYKWKARHNQGLPTTVKTITNLTKTGDIQPESTLVHKISFTLTDNFYEELVRLSGHKVRTINAQVEYLIKRELNRTMNHSNDFPF